MRGPRVPPAENGGRRPRDDLLCKHAEAEPRSDPWINQPGFICSPASSPPAEIIFPRSPSPTRGGPWSLPPPLTMLRFAASAARRSLASATRLSTTNGSLCGASVQPESFVKVCFVLIGALLESLSASKQQPAGCRHLHFARQTATSRRRAFSSAEGSLRPRKARQGKPIQQKTSLKPLGMRAQPKKHQGENQQGKRVHRSRS